MGTEIHVNWEKCENCSSKDNCKFIVSTLGAISTLDRPADNSNIILFFFRAAYIDTERTTVMRRHCEQILETIFRVDNVTCAHMHGTGTGVGTHRPTPKQRTTQLNILI